MTTATELAKQYSVIGNWFGLGSLADEYPDSRRDILEAANVTEERLIAYYRGYLGITDALSQGITLESLPQSWESAAELVACPDAFFPELPLNEDQQKALEQWRGFLKTDGMVFTLQGAAGTGKTYTAKRLLKEFGGKTQIVAPTHAARKLHGNGAITVAKALGLKPGKSEEGKLVFGHKNDDGEDEKGENPLAGVKCVLLDEGGMVDKAQLEELVSRVQEQGGKILIMGDSYQLPPVGNKGAIISPAFDQADDGAILTQVMRNQGPVLQYASKLREAMRQVRETAEMVGEVVKESTPINIPHIAPDGIDIIELPRKQWEDEAIEFFKANQDPFAGRVIFYRNEQVRKFNAQCQLGVYGSAEYQVGQKLICYKPVSRLEQQVYQTRRGPITKVGTKILADNSEVLTITGTPTVTTYDSSRLWQYEEELTRSLFGGVEILLIPCENEDGVKMNLRVPTEEGSKAIVMVTGEFKGGKKIKNGLIDDYFASRKVGKNPSMLFDGCTPGMVATARHQAENICFDYAQPYWASTTHKAQGCTISEKLFVDTTDLLSPTKWGKPMLAASLLYTAITRASGKVYIPSN